MNLTGGCLPVLPKSYAKNAWNYAHALQDLWREAVDVKVSQLNVLAKVELPRQAMETAIKANKNISTAPAIGSTKGMEDTTASTGSISWVWAWVEGVDIMFPSAFLNSQLGGFYPCDTMNTFIRFFLALGSLAAVGSAVVGCSATGPQSPNARPVLYPNATLNRVGDAKAQLEIDACIRLAQAAGLTPDEKNNETGRRAGLGAATGGVAAAVGALVTGRGVSGAVRSGAAGAAVGGSAGAVSGALHEKPSNTYRYFVQRCLKDKGFDVIGWN